MNLLSGFIKVEIKLNPSKGYIGIRLNIARDKLITVQNIKRYAKKVKNIFPNAINLSKKKK